MTFSPDSKSAKQVRKKEKAHMRCKVCSSLKFPTDSPKGKSKTHFAGLSLNRMEEPFKVTCIFH